MVTHLKGRLAIFHAQTKVDRERSLRAVKRLYWRSGRIPTRLRLERDQHLQKEVADDLL